MKGWSGMPDALHVQLRFSVPCPSGSCKVIRDIIDALLTLVDAQNIEWEETEESED